MFENSEVAVGFRGFSEHCDCCIPTDLQVLWSGCEAELVPVSGDTQRVSTAAAVSVSGLNPSLGIQLRISSCSLYTSHPWDPWEGDESQERRPQPYNTSG